MMQFQSILANLLNREPTLSVPRDPGWREIRNAFLIDNGSICAVCGKVKNLNVHHIIPVHVDKTLELETSNLIVLCENKTPMNCHLGIGHLGNFKAYNPHVKEDAVFWKDRIKNRKQKV